MSDRWVEVDASGQAFLVDELDGWAYLRAQARGDVLRSRDPVTVTRIESGDPWWRVHYKGGPWNGSVPVGHREALALAERLGMSVT